MDDNGRRTGTGQTIKGVVVTGGSLPFAARASSPSTIKHQVFQCYKMVLPDRIELSTSPLPMECSTTELRQRARITGIGQIGPTRRPILATRPPLAQARGWMGRLGLPPVQRGMTKERTVPVGLRHNGTTGKIPLHTDPKSVA
jgi:hypothetical protein